MRDLARQIASGQIVTVVGAGVWLTAGGPADESEAADPPAVAVRNPLHWHVVQL
jgi:hypothetical protein